MCQIIFNSTSLFQWPEWFGRAKLNCNCKSCNSNSRAHVQSRQFRGTFGFHALNWQWDKEKASYVIYTRIVKPGLVYQISNSQWLWDASFLLRYKPSQKEYGKEKTIEIYIPPGIRIMPISSYLLTTPGKQALPLKDLFQKQQWYINRSLRGTNHLWKDFSKGN